MEMVLFALGGAWRLVVFMMGWVRDWDKLWDRIYGTHEISGDWLLPRCLLTLDIVVIWRRKYQYWTGCCRNRIN